MEWQKKLCQDHTLRGRIIIAHEGINGTVGGSIKNIEHYIAAMRQDPLFNDIDFKKSEGNADCFPRLRIVVKDEIVRLGLDPQKVNVKHTGQHLNPEETHELIKQKSNDLIILDCRNNFESKVGTFQKAIKADIRHFREFPNYIDNNLNLFKDKQVLMYCTGGIRCERATAYLKLKNVAKEVYQIKGGIHRYVEQYPNGYFRGKNYVFDGRITVKVNDDIISTCDVCNTSCDEFINCSNAQCNKHFVCCKVCIQKLNNTCSATCQNLVRDNKVQCRPPIKKADMQTKTPGNT